MVGRVGDVDATRTVEGDICGPGEPRFRGRPVGEAAQCWRDSARSCQRRYPAPGDDADAVGTRIGDIQRARSVQRKALGGDLPAHVGNVFAALKHDGTIVPVAGHGPTREYRWRSK